LAKITSAIAGTPFNQILELCVGDTLDRGRRAFPKTKAEFVAVPNGQTMFQIARKALVSMAAHINYINAQMDRRAAD